MDLTDIILNPDKTKNICCLCYKHTENPTWLHEDIEFQDKYLSFKTTLSRIMNSIFLQQELLLTHMCENCSNLIMKIFCLLKENQIKQDLLYYLANNLDKEIEEVEYKLFYKSKMQKCKLNINLPTRESIVNLHKTNTSCVKCSMKFNSKLLLKKHTQMAHKNANNGSICDVCGKVFTKKSKLIAHLGCHKQRQCPHCFKTVKSQSHVNIHLKSHTSTIKMKRKSKHYDCNYCNYRSFNKSSLEAHINKIHLGIKPFVCGLCHNGFYKKDNLVQHLATHNKNKDKICDICGDIFRMEKTLQEHLKIHSGQKPFKCELCNIGFITSGRRHEHIKRKHMEKNESCIVCGKKFSLKKSLNTHLKKVHNAEIKNVILKVNSNSDQPSFETVKTIRV